MSIYHKNQRLRCKSRAGRLGRGHRALPRSLNRSSQVLVTTKTGILSKVWNAVGFTNIGALHQHIKRGCVGKKFSYVVGHYVRMVVVTNTIVIVCPKVIQGCAVSQQAGVGASVFAKKCDAFISKTNQRWMCFI